MYYVMDAHSFYNFIYFILLIIVSIRASSGPWTIALGLGAGRGRGGVGSPQGALWARGAWKTGGSQRSRQSVSEEGIF